MKALSILVFFLFLSSVAWSQQKIDKRLLSGYSESELKALETTNPEELSLITYALDNGMYIGNYSAEKEGAYKEIDRPEINQTYMDLNFQILDRNQYFKIKGEEKVLVVKSKGVLMNELKNK